MRVDELNDETEARMDALVDRTRALEARCDAAEKRAEEAERDLTLAIESKLANGRLTRLLVETSDSEVASLRAQVEQLTVERGDYAVKADGLYREIQRLVAQVEQMRGDVERERGFKADIGNMLQSAIGTLRGIAQAKRFDREVFADDSSFVDWATSRARWEVAAHDSAAKALADRAALSPSPASADDCEHDTEPMGGGLVCKRCKMVFLPCPGCNDAEAHGIVYHAPPLCPVGAPSSVSALFPGVPLVPHEGPVTYEPKTTLPEVEAAGPCQHDLKREGDRCQHGLHFGTTCLDCMSQCSDCASLYTSGAAAKEPSGAAGDRCEPGNECGRTGCEECQR